jgi:hypothetical protein
MALIRGLHSQCPCPVCVVTKDGLGDHRHSHPLRDKDETIAHYELWLEKSCAVREKILKEQSLRPVEVRFGWR